MIPLSLHDKSAIEAYLRRDPYLYLYLLGDLDEFFWPYTSWYARQEAEQITALLLLYTGSGLPTVLAFAGQGSETLKALLHDCLPLLPRRFYTQLSPGLVEVLAGSYRVEPHGQFLKMGLTLPERIHSVDTAGIAPLLPADEPELLRFYEQAYPGNWFNPRMLETGCYYAARIAGRLAAVAGIHVYSPQYRAAALGNITTLPEFRGQGLATRVTARLCQQLSQEVDFIGLNVRADNAAAQAVYTRLGFTPLAEYEEHSVEQA
jgi:ribosomal protein S18 acetylase RimI-like enzyme